MFNIPYPVFVLSGLNFRNHEGDGFPFAHGGEGMAGNAADDIFMSGVVMPSVNLFHFAGLCDDIPDFRRIADDVVFLHIGIDVLVQENIGLRYGRIRQNGAEFFKLIFRQERIGPVQVFMVVKAAVVQVIGIREDEGSAPRGQGEGRIGISREPAEFLP